jgi:signal transduction histidine kinase
MTTALGDVVVEEPTEILCVSRDHFPDMIRTCHELTAILVHVMLDRARHFTSSDLHVEKLQTLGRIAAQLAHELNNPASAVARSAKALIGHLSEMQEAFRRLGAGGLSDEQLAAIDQIRQVCLARPIAPRSTIEQADREDSLTDWLESHGVDVVASVGALADSAITLDQLERLASALPAEQVGLALQSIVADCATRRLAAEIEVASLRIHGLVTAVKGFAYLDQAAAPRPVDIGQGLTDTLIVLRAKARAKSVAVGVTVEPGLPTVRGLGGELNQVWLNLIDNAIDAVPASGHVEINASRQDDSVVVRVVDDGPGIPPDIFGRIFEPFFTTKPEGEGTGQGLEIARQIVGRHRGTIEAESRPGHTEFRVTLPIAGIQ